MIIIRYYILIDNTIFVTSVCIIIYIFWLFYYYVKVILVFDDVLDPKFILI